MARTAHSPAASPDLERRLRKLCGNRADTIRAVVVLLRQLLEGQPADVEWALTDPDGKVFAYVTLAAEWQRKQMTSVRSRELAARSRAAVAPHGHDLN